MTKVGGLVLPTSRTAVIAAISLLLVLSSLAIIHQLTRAQIAPASHAQIINSTGSPPTGDNTINSSSTSSSAADIAPAGNSSQTSVTVNGQSIDVPQNGSVSQTIESGGTTTNVDVQSSNSSTTTGQAGNSNHSSLNVRVRSTASSSQESL